MNKNCLSDFILTEIFIDNIEEVNVEYILSHNKFPFAVNKRIQKDDTSDYLDAIHKLYEYIIEVSKGEHSSCPFKWNEDSEEWYFFVNIPPVFIKNL